MDKMRKWMLHGSKDLQLHTCDVPEIPEDHVLVKPRRVGVCGSDLKYYQYGKIASFVVKHPFILGHEASGEIVDANGHEGLAQGTRVAIEPSHPCYVCEFCRTGRYNLCRKMRYLGSAAANPHVNGTFTEMFTIPAVNCYPFDERVSFGEAALLEPLSIALHSIKRAPSVAGKTVLITGGGTIGQMILAGVRAFGASMVAVSDPVEQKRAWAVENGADATFNVDAAGVTAMNEATGGRGYDFVFEASGFPAALNQAFESVGIGGTIVQVGFLPGDQEIPVNLLLQKELQVLGSFRFANVFQMAIDMLAAGRIKLDNIITHVFPFEELPQAIEQAIDGNSSLKVQVEI